MNIKDQGRSTLTALTIGALGIVFGDIGTSPLYALKECLTHFELSGGVDQANVLGVLSLIVWAMLLQVTLKYVIFLMRADNEGEGGIMALLALLPDRFRRPQTPVRVGITGMLVIAGAALLFGDGIITPAISVLSAVEGIEVATPALKNYVVPITSMILFGLFWIQRRGTADISRWFGPVMLAWFATIATLGVVSIVQTPEVLVAFNPRYAIRFFVDHGWEGFAILGGVVLVVTGGEAIYADMGHFGRTPIRRAWMWITLPALTLCYFGQGANALRDPSTIAAPLYSLVPQGSLLLYPLIVLATSATIIASQALITSVFSLTNQGIRLGFFPRVTVLHTSSTHEGQIYVPIMNWGLAVCCILLVAIFGESAELAAAYGLAVSGTMLITSIVYFLVIRYTWGWSGWKAYPLLALFLFLDSAFLGANLLKFFEGGYIPVVVGVVIFIAMANWRLGRLLLADHFQSDFRPLEGFTKGELCSDVARVPGTAVFMASQADGVPPVLTRMVDRFHVLQQNVILLTVIGDHVPRVAPENKVRTEKLGNGFYRVLVRVGFMEMPHVPRKLKVALGELDLDVDPEEIIYILGHETFVVQSKGRMSQFNQGLFAFLSRNARNATDYFRIPPRQVIELGAQIKL